MICIPGKCIKCATKIAHSHLYNELHFEMDDESILHVGICNQCEIAPEEYEDMIGAINDAYRTTSTFQLKAKVKQFKKRTGLVDALKMLQGGRCLVCHNSIGENWIVTNGSMTHEKCSLPPPAPLKAWINPMPGVQERL